MRGDGIIKAGFWLQIVFLGLVDWGTLVAFSRGETQWYHYAGFIVVNAILLFLAYIMWGWLRQQQGPKPHG